MRDILYGAFVPDRLTVALMHSPEVLRLRGVRLSNVDAWSVPAFATASRYEHIWGVARLAAAHIANRDYDDSTALNIKVAAVYHDVATPAFGHSLESLLEGYDHEREARALLGLAETDYNWRSRPIYAGQSVGVARILRRLGLETKVDLDIVANFIVGRGSHGMLISGELDLDNLDNVTRAAYYSGLAVSHEAPLLLARHATCAGGRVVVDHEGHESLLSWVEARNTLYDFFATSEPMIQREAALTSLLAAAVREGLLPRELWFCTDEELIRVLQNCSVRSIRDRVRRYLLNDSPRLVSVLQVSVSGRGWRAKRFAFEAALEEATGHEVATIVKWYRRWSAATASESTSARTKTYIVTDTQGPSAQTSVLRVYLGSRLRTSGTGREWKRAGRADFRALARVVEDETRRAFAQD